MVSPTRRSRQSEVDKTCHTANPECRPLAAPACSTIRKGRRRRFRAVLSHRFVYTGLAVRRAAVTISGLDFNAQIGSIRRLSLGVVAAEFARVYPPLAAQLADLLGRLRASDDRIERMNAHALPRGCGPLLVAELVARELDSFVRNSVDIPRIVRRVQLPAFEYDIHAPYAWPRSSSVDAGSLMFRAISELGSRSA